MKRMFILSLVALSLAVPVFTGTFVGADNQPLSYDSVDQGVPSP